MGPQISTEKAILLFSNIKPPAVYDVCFCNTLSTQPAGSIEKKWLRTSWITVDSQNVKYATHEKRNKV